MNITAITNSPLGSIFLEASNQGLIKSNNWIYRSYCGKQNPGQFFENGC